MKKQEEIIELEAEEITDNQIGSIPINISPKPNYSWEEVEEMMGEESSEQVGESDHMFDAIQTSMKSFKNTQNLKINFK